MLQRIDIPCPGCPEERLVFDVSVNEFGNQAFADGQMQRKVTCDQCGTTALVTLHGAGNEPTIARIPMPPKQNRESRRQR